LPAPGGGIDGLTTQRSQLSPPIEPQTKPPNFTRNQKRKKKLNLQIKPPRNLCSQETQRAAIYLIGEGGEEMGSREKTTWEYFPPPPPAPVDSSYRSPLHTQYPWCVYVRPSVLVSCHSRLAPTVPTVTLLAIESKRIRGRRGRTRLEQEGSSEDSFHWK